MAEGATVGSLPADSEQFMMIEDLYKTVDKLNAHIESLKDEARDMHYKNGNGQW